MQIQVLGELQITEEETLCQLSAPKPRQVLAMLIVNANRTVSTPLLIEELWADTPPPSVATTLQTYVFQLRLALSDMPSFAGDRRSIRRFLATRPSGYQLCTATHDVDVHAFQWLYASGREALHKGDAERASQHLTRALALWRGPALAGVRTGLVLASVARELEEQRLATLECRIEADLRLGRHRELIGELVALVMEHPLHEGLHAQLMVALSGAGRRSEALEVYRRLRTRLVQEVGLEPSAPVQQTQRAVLSDDRCFEHPLATMGLGGIAI